MLIAELVPGPTAPAPVAAAQQIGPSAVVPQAQPQMHSVGVAAEVSVAEAARRTKAAKEAEQAQAAPPPPIAPVRWEDAELMSYDYSLRNERADMPRAKMPILSPESPRVTQNAREGWALENRNRKT